MNIYCSYSRNDRVNEGNFFLNDQIYLLCHTVCLLWFHIWWDLDLFSVWLRTKRARFGSLEENLPTNSHHLQRTQTRGLAETNSKLDIILLGVSFRMNNVLYFFSVFPCQAEKLAWQGCVTDKQKHTRRNACVLYGWCYGNVAVYFCFRLLERFKSIVL